MIATGIYIYLPDHLRAIYGHLYYYWVGERPFIATRLSASAGSALGDVATQSLVVYEAAKTAVVGSATEYMGEL